MDALGPMRMDMQEPQGQVRYFVALYAYNPDEVSPNQFDEEPNDELHMLQGPCPSALACIRTRTRTRICICTCTRNHICTCTRTCVTTSW